LQTRTKATTSARPGSTPATNSAPIDTPDTSEYRMSGIDGGIRIAIVAAALLLAATKAAG
jgi:hypothetical protein